MQVGWLNPRIDSHNLGDEIIEAAVGRELDDLIGPNAQVIQLPTQRFLTLEERRRAAQCDIFVVGGTNLLNGNIPRYIQWKLDPWVFSKYAGQVVLLGVGWWQYQNVNAISSRVWRGLLRGQTHSVRDNYTLHRLRGLGVSAVNTTCPTMWRLPEEIQFGPRRSKVIATVTDYHRNVSRDRRMFHHLRANYDEVLVWLQGSKDYKYLTTLGADIDFVDPSLSAFDAVVESGEVDYFGTRLHAGIRALQRGVRSTIVSIDNRATEIARDTGLAVVQADFVGQDVNESVTKQTLRLTLPREDIEAWRSSFRDALAGT